MVSFYPEVGIFFPANTSSYLSRTVRKEVYAAQYINSLPDLLLAPLNGVYFFFLRRATLPCYARFRLAWRRCCEASPIENRGAESLKSSQSGTE